MLHKKRKPSTFTSSSGYARENLLHSKSTYFYRWFSNKKSIEGHSFSNTTYLVPSLCGIALLVGLGIALTPICNNSDNKAFAETITSNPTYYSSISMTLSNNETELDNNSTASTNVAPGLVNYIDNNIKIFTSKIDRFYITVQAAEDSTSELTGTAHGETIAPVDADTSVTSFSDNTWGYALGEVNTANVDFVYNPLPEYNTVTKPQYSSAQELTDGEYNLKLTFAAKINADKPSDHYTTKAMVSVAADAAKLTSMQEFAKAGSCSTLDGQVQLRDSRDDKIYWVGKINGECMMTQNLDLDIPSTGLSKDDTDITDDWNTNIVATLASDEFTWTDDNNSVFQSYDPGEYIINQATSSWTACPTTKDPTKCNRYTLIDGDTPNTDLHYAVGNYYNWYAATAGTGGTTATGEASGSICPKGWQLLTNSGTKSFQTILNGKNQTTVRQGPTYFPAAGGTYSGGLGNVGSVGAYWSSTCGSNASLAYRLNFDSSNFNPQNNPARYGGNSVRCVLRD